MQASAGISLRLGNTSYTVGSASPRITLQDLPEASFSGSADSEQYDYTSGVFDFEMLGGELGESQLVILPLEIPLAQNSLYRKYDVIRGEWRDFIRDENNAVFSAEGSLGTCPAPGSEQYTSGLNEGHRCVQLLIGDGGPNDADGEVNGVIKDPGAIATPAQVQTPSEQSESGEPEVDHVEGSSEPQSPDNVVSEPEIQAAGKDYAVGVKTGGVSVNILFLLLVLISVASADFCC